jgi:hypothetical protein
MAKVKIKKRICERCPVGREQPATRVETISLGSTRWRLELCENCGRRLEQDMWSWGRLGKPLDNEESRPFGTYDIAGQRRAAELRSVQVNAERPKRPDTPEESIDLGPGRRWVFSANAMERLDEFHIRAVDVLRAADDPFDIRDANIDDGILATLAGHSKVYEGHGVKFVVDLKSNQILTVAKSTSEKDSNDHNGSRSEHYRVG